MRIKSLEDAADVGRRSNTSAHLAYGVDFAEISASRERLDELDLFALETASGPIPILKNGRNFFWERACLPLGFHQSRFDEWGLDFDRFLVIHEGPGFVPNISPFSRARAALTAMMDVMPAEFLRDKFRVPELGGPVETHLRAFDSHPNLAFYLKVVVDLLDEFGLDSTIPEIEILERPYPCDLATRFSDVAADACFIQNRFMTRDIEADRERNSGRARIFENPHASLRQHLVLIGDSHSFSGLSLLFPYFFERVSYFWASRGSKYGGLREAIETACADADIVIEESSERFFIRNFGIMPKGVPDPEAK